MLGNINLFLNRLTVEEIAKLDKNKDGKISNEEAQGALFTFGDRFSDAEFISLTGSAKTPAPSSNLPTTSSDVPKEAKTTAELRTYFTKMKDGFIEKYVGGLLESGEIDQTSKKSLILYINTNARTYIEGYIKNAKAPYDTQAIFAEFEGYIAEKIEERKAAQESVDVMLNDVKKNTDANYEKLMAGTEKADKEYITKEEYADLKDNAAEYILGIMAKGEEGGEFEAFMTALDPKYKDNINYKVAKKALELLETEKDPFKVQEIINNAKTAIGKLIGDMDEYGDGSTPLTDAVKARTKYINNEKYSAQLDKYIDKAIEEASNQNTDGTFDPEAAKVRTMALKTAFLSQYEGDGTDLEAAFQEFLTKANDEYDKVQGEIREYTKKITSRGRFDAINKAIESAGSYVSNAEKDSIYNAGVDYVMNKILNGKEDKLLASINAKYVYFPQYIEAKSLIDNLLTSATPEADFAKAKALIKELLESQGVDKIIKFADAENKRIEEEKAIEERKNVNLSVAEMTSGLWGYGTTETKGGDNLVYTSFTIQDGNVQWTNGDDNGDINKMYNQLRQRIHAKMKEQLGDKYNEEEINKYFEQAIVNTAMNLDNPTGLHSIEEIANNTVAQFNTIATAALHGESTQKTKDKIDMKTILTEAGQIDNYCKGSIAKGKGWAFPLGLSVQILLLKVPTAIINTIKTQLGDKFDEVEITRLLHQAVNETVNAVNKETNADVIYKHFFNSFNRLYEGYLAQKGYTINE